MPSHMIFKNPVSRYRNEFISARVIREGIHLNRYKPFQDTEIFKVAAEFSSKHFFFRNANDVVLQSYLALDRLSIPPPPLIRFYLI